MAKKKKPSAGKAAMFREAKKANLAEGKGAPKLKKPTKGAEKIPLAKFGKAAKAMGLPKGKGGEKLMSFPSKKKKKGA